MKFKERFNFYSNIFLIIILIFSGLIWADTNGIWTNASDVRGGTFGLDEQPDTNNYTFINSVIVNSNITVRDFVESKYPIKDNHSANMKYFNNTFSSLVPLILNCNKQGMVYNGSTCNYVNGSDITPNIFDFPLTTGVEFNIMVNSSEVIVDGFGYNLDIELKNNDTTASIIKNGVDTNSIKVGVNNGDRIKIKLLSKNNYSNTSSVNIILGDYQTYWSVTTKPDVTFEYIYANDPKCSGICTGGAQYVPNSESLNPTAVEYCRNGWSWDWGCKKLFSNNIIESVPVSFCGGIHASGNTCNP